MIPTQIEPLVSQWEMLQSQAANEYLNDSKIEAHRLYELAGKLEDDIYAACCIAGISQIKLRRKEVNYARYYSSGN